MIYIFLYIFRFIGRSENMGGQVVIQGLLKAKVLLIFLPRYVGKGPIDPLNPLFPTSLHMMCIQRI